MADLLRFATAGSVDDGKSTLIGRLLFDTKSIMVDQMEAVERVSNEQGSEYTNLALLTDGLRAEREQGITIDVAYRYFATPKRTFIIADTPGHIQYTRNMVTGASTADLAIVLVDARKGLVEQSRRHAFLTSLLGVNHIVVAINKMDMVDWDEAIYNRIREEFEVFAARLDVQDVIVIPISALHGDNVVSHSANSPWYDGPTLLHHLENVHVSGDRNLVDVRFPVQYVIRPHDNRHHDYRGYAGSVAGGALRTGDEIMVLPSGLKSRIAAIDGPSGPVEIAYPPMAVTIRLEDNLDISRGDMLCRPNNSPMSIQDIEAMVCWMTDQPLRAGAKLAIKHTTRTARAVVRDLHYKLDINTLHRETDAESLGLNDIGRIRMRTTAPLFCDDYHRNRTTGGFVLIDETNNRTVGAGMVVGSA
jgi:bifunctional enzyme CysN/CysC